MVERCEWPGTDPLLVEYHDKEWGTPEHDDRKLFELLILEGAQAGLSWQTILRKRENYRRAFSSFNVGKIAEYDDAKVMQLLSDEGIIRNRLKIAAAIQNARAFLAIQGEFSSFDSYVWAFVDGKSRRNSWRSMQEIPATTHESDVLSKDLKGRGFKFVGSTICYAFMQAVGMVNDHQVNCFRFDEVAPD